MPDSDHLAPPAWYGSVDWREVERWLNDGADPAAHAAPDALLRLGRFVDAADLTSDDARMAQAVQLGERVAERLSGCDEAVALYFLGNAHHGRWGYERRTAPPDRNGWKLMWHSPHAEQTVLSYRKAIVHPAFIDLEPERRCQIHTNLGNALSALGLALDATREYDRALELVPSFAMARGNRANAMSAYANSLYDVSDRWIIYRYALADAATAATSPDHVEADAREGFVGLHRRLYATLAPAGGWGGTWRPFEPSLGDTPDERAYRRWCLRHRLFLNPLNDLGPYPAAAFDTVVPPSITVEAEEGPPAALGAFNQLKQGFATARYLLYAGSHRDGTHFSDRDVTLIDTLDFSSYGYHVEQVKLAFRSLYGLFDQIAFLVNEHFRLGVEPRRVAFRTLWYRKQDPRKGLRDDVTERQNGALVALFWLSKDLYEVREGFVDALQPDAQRLSEVRNHLEHRYLKVHAVEPDRAAFIPAFRDPLAYSVSRSDLESRSLHLAWLARSALMYLGIAIHVEETTHRKRPEGLTMPIFPTVIDDESKRRW